MNILMKDKDGVTQHRHVTPETAEKKEILKKFTHGRQQTASY